MLIKEGFKFVVNRGYGTHRVLEPKHVLPTSAWRLDNRRSLFEGEMRIEVKKIHIETTSFKEICLEANDNDERIRQKIMDIVIRRGKLHNPVTDTGGLLYGVVSEISEGFLNYKGFENGDEVICNASLTVLPLYIDNIISIDKAYGQIEVEGYCIVSNEIPVVKKPQELPVNLLLFVFNESGTIYRINNMSVGKRKFLVVGNNLLLNILFGFAIKKVARDDAQIVCMLDKKTDMVLKGDGVNKLKKELFEEIHYVDILKPLECLDSINGYETFDLSVNCAGIQGAETINILATKSGGTVIFANLINNYNMALYITEAVSRPLDIRCADGYLEAYDEFDFEMVRELMPYVNDAEETNIKISDDLTHPLGGKSKFVKISSVNQSMMEDFICESRAMSAVLDEVLTVSQYDCNVLVTGEPGAGKEKIAGIIHRQSNRKLQPLIKVNCASLPEDNIEAKFFGYESKNGNHDSGRKGYFELAENGSLFLDEISELNLGMQAKLLRVIQDGEYFKIGSIKPTKFNIRIISSTNREIEDAIEEGRFRRDLYYKLNVIRIRVPALRDRPADIPPLISHFLISYNKKFGIKRSIDDDAIEYLCRCEWKGNIRELENFVQRIMIANKSEEITQLSVMKELHADVFNMNVITEKLDDSESEIVSMEIMVQNLEKNVIKHALEKYGSTRKASKAIGISQTQLVRKKNKYGL